jgi:hypothetical protein
MTAFCRLVVVVVVTLSYREHYTGRDGYSNKDKTGNQKKERWWVPFGVHGCCCLDDGAFYEWKKE